MRVVIKTLLLAGFWIFAETAVADIPGLGVIQEARITDPMLGLAGERSGFGGAGMDFIGDVDGDGVQDLIVGAPNSPQDTGSLAIVRLERDGRIKGTPAIITGFDPFIKPKLLTKPKWGTGLAVAKGFSGPGSCGVVVVNMGNSSSTKIWALNICVDNSPVPAPYISNAVVIDSTDPALTGLQMKKGGIGRSIAVLDVTPQGNIILGLGSPNDGSDPVSYQGRVIILELKPSTLTFSRKAAYPEAYVATDPVAQKLVAQESFGWSLAPFRTANGGKGMVVVSRYFGAPATTTGRVSLIMFDNNYGMASWKTISGLSNPSVSGPPTAIATADFNRDGNSDLVVGYSTEQYTGGVSLVAGVGSFQIASMTQDGDVINSSLFKKGVGGFMDANNELGYNAQFGFRLIAGDFDGDSQSDVVIGSYGNALGTPTGDIVGSIWSLRMKMSPWHKKTVDRVTLTNRSSGPILLRDYILGNRLGWTLKEDQSVPTTLDSCAIVGQADSAALWCYPGKTNGESKWIAIAADSGNSPSTIHIADTLKFVVQVKDQDSAPQQLAPLPQIVITEEQKDTAIIAFSKYFRDPEKIAMTFTLSALNNSTTGLFSQFYQSTNTDTIHVVGNPFHFGLCSLKVEVRDNANAKIVDTLVIHVAHVNHAPIALGYAFNVIESKIDTFTVIRKDSDPDGEAVTTTIVKAPSHGSATILSSGAIRYIPTTFYLGADSIRYAIHDKTDSGLAWVKIIIGPTTMPTSLYKPLRDTEVVESVAPIVIGTDSLFFNGTKRFAIGSYFPKSDCQNLAVIDYIDSTHRLTITPLPAKWGRCQIYMRAVVVDSVASTMYLMVDSIPTPYKFPVDSFSISLTVDNTTVYALDSLDKDGDTLSYSAALANGNILPGWIKINRFQIVLSPTSTEWDEIKFMLNVRKKYGTGVYALPSDSVAIYTRFNQTSAIKGRHVGGSTISFSNVRDRMEIMTGSDAARVELLSIDGRILVLLSLSPKAKALIDLSRVPRLVYLRLIEGSRTSITPLYIPH